MLVVWNVFARTSSIAFRLLLKDRAFTVTTLLTLALCIGANAAIFAVVNSVAAAAAAGTRSGPAGAPLQQLSEGRRRAGSSTGVPDYYDRLRETDVFEELALYNQRGRDGRRRRTARSG